jgi:hypothetical protein
LEDGCLGVKRPSELTGNEISRASRTLEVLSELRPVERDPASQAVLDGRGVPQTRFTTTVGFDTSRPWWDNAQTYRGE